MPELKRIPPPPIRDGVLYLPIPEGDRCISEDGARPTHSILVFHSSVNLPTQGQLVIGFEPVLNPNLIRRVMTPDATCIVDLNKDSQTDGSEKTSSSLIINPREYDLKARLQIANASLCIFPEHYSNDEENIKRGNEFLNWIEGLCGSIVCTTKHLVFKLNQCVAFGIDNDEISVIHPQAANHEEFVEVLEPRCIDANNGRLCTDNYPGGLTYRIIATCPPFSINSDEISTAPFDNPDLLQTSRFIVEFFNTGDFYTDNNGRFVCHRVIVKTGFSVGSIDFSHIREQVNPLMEAFLTGCATEEAIRQVVDVHRSLTIKRVVI